LKKAELALEKILLVLEEQESKPAEKEKKDGTLGGFLLHRSLQRMDWVMGWRKLSTSMLVWGRAGAVQEIPAGGEKELRMGNVQACMGQKKIGRRGESFVAVMAALLGWV